MHEQRPLLAGTVIPPTRSEAACRRGFVAPLVLDEWQSDLVARERILYGPELDGRPWWVSRVWMRLVDATTG